MSSSHISLHKRLFNAWLIFVFVLALIAGFFFVYLINLQQNTVTSELHREVILVGQMLENRLLFDRRHATALSSDNSLRVLVQLKLWSQVAGTLAQSNVQAPIRAAWVLARDEAILSAYPSRESDFCPMTLSGPSERFMVHKGRLNHLVRRAIYSRDRVLLGFLVIAFVYPDQSFLDQLGTDQKQFIAVVKGNQVVAASTPLDLGDLEATRLMHHRDIRTFIDGKSTHFLVEKTVLDFFDGDLTLYLLRDLEPIQKPLQRLGIILLVFSFLVACGCFGFYVYIKRRIIVPIVSLSQAARDIRETDSIAPLEKLVYATPSRDEIGSLIKSFKALVGYLNTARREAESVSEMKDAFLATVSHEVRTPLNGIYGMTQLLQRSGLTARQERYASNMLISIHNLLSIINDVLDISKVKAKGFSIHEQQVDLPELLASIHQAHLPVAQAKGLGMPFECDDIPGHVRTDPLRLQQVLNNLVSNALKFTDSGYVLLRAELVSHEESASRCQIRFTVEDSGIGIPPDRQGSIFQPFIQVDNGLARKYPGTGLGLSIAAEIVALLGGDRILLTSTPDKGSTFSFILDLPMQSDALEEAEDAPHDRRDAPVPSPSLPPTTFQDLSILVAEDNSMNQELVVEIFEVLEISDYHLCSNGQETLDALFTGPNQYDVLLLDIQMPGMDGFTVATTIRARGCEIPIVAMTGLASDKDREKSRLSGIDHFLSKPFTLDDLEAILKSLS